MTPSAELERLLMRAFPSARVEACTELSGGVSARAVVVDLVIDGVSKRVVVRRPTRDTAEEAMRTAESEYRILLRCAELGLPTPKPCAFDTEARAVILEYVVGRPEFSPRDEGPMLAQMAERLAQIHAFGPLEPLQFLERYDERTARELLRAPEALDHSLDEPLLRAELSRLWPWPRHNADALLHGDYWPGNLLWRESKLVAVLDWEEAAIGDPLADIAITRLDLLWAFGRTAMQTFTEHYRARTQLDWRNLSRWDLRVALRPMSNLARWAPAYSAPPISRPDITEFSMRDGHGEFVEQALRDLRVP